MSDFPGMPRHKHPRRDAARLKQLLDLSLSLLLVVTRAAIYDYDHPLLNRLCIALTMVVA
jgi:hypothetical protein